MRKLEDRIAGVHENTISFTIEGREFSCTSGKKNYVFTKQSKILVSHEMLQKCDGNMILAAKMILYGKIAAGFSKNSFTNHLILGFLISNDDDRHIISEAIDRTTDIGKYPIYLQVGVLQQFSSLQSYEVAALSTERFHDKKLEEYIQELYTLLRPHNLLDPTMLPSTLLLVKQIGEWEKSASEIYAALHALELQRKKRLEKKLRTEEKQADNILMNLIVPPQADGTYEPADILEEADEEDEQEDIDNDDETDDHEQPTEKVMDACTIIQPPIQGYYKRNSMQRFEGNFQWYYDMNSLSPVSLPTPLSAETKTVKMQQVMGGNIQLLALPYGYTISQFDHTKVALFINAHGDYFIKSIVPGNSITEISLTKDHAQDSDYRIPDGIYYEALFNIAKTKSIYNFINGLTGLSEYEKVEAIRKLILKKIYCKEYQAKYVRLSKSKEEYFEYLFNADKLECYSANTLFVGLLREVGVAARLSCGFYAKVIIDDKLYITSEDGHAWAEVYKNGDRHIVDATPTGLEKDSTGKEEEKSPSDEHIERKDDTLIDVNELMKSIDPKELEEVRKEIEQSKESIAYGLGDLTADFSESELKYFEALFHENQPKAEHITNELVKYLRGSTLLTQKTTRNTKKNTGLIDIKKILRENPEFIHGSLNSINQLMQGKNYITSSTRQMETIGYKKLRIIIGVDTSGSMDNNTNGNEPEKRYKKAMSTIMMLWMVFSKMSTILQECNSEACIDLYTFDSSTKCLFRNVLLTMDMDVKRTILEFISKLPSLTTGNSTNDISLLERIYRDNYSKDNIDENEVKLGFIITDEEGQPGREVQKRLLLLQKECHVPMISLNVGTPKGDHTAQQKAGYYYSADYGPATHLDLVTLTSHALLAKIV